MTPCFEGHGDSRHVVSRGLPGAQNENVSTSAQTRHHGTAEACTVELLSNAHVATNIDVTWLLLTSVDPPAKSEYIFLGLMENTSMYIKKLKSKDLTP